MPLKPKTTRTIAALSTRRGLALTKQELERDKVSYEQRIAAEFATAVTLRLNRRFELDPELLPEADPRDAILRDEHGAEQLLQLVEVRDVGRQRRLADQIAPTSAECDLVSIEQAILDRVREKCQKCASSRHDGLWLVIHSCDYPASVLMFACRAAREFLANSPPPFSVIWAFHATTQPDATSIEQLWPRGSESYLALLTSDAPPSAFRGHLWRGEEIVHLSKVRRSNSRG